MYFDFQKAYDNVNHNHLLKLLDIYGFPRDIQDFLTNMVMKMKVELRYDKSHPVGKVRLENGNIQGDALSPLLFVLTVDPLIKMLKKKHGENIEMMHYRDDLKIRINNIETRKEVYEKIKRMRRGTGMVLNIKKSGIDVEEENHTEELQELPPNSG